MFGFYNTEIFLPVIEVKGQSGSYYNIDIRGLFYADSSQLTKKSIYGPVLYH